MRRMGSIWMGMVMLMGAGLAVSPPVSAADRSIDEVSTAAARGGAHEPAAATAQAQPKSQGKKAKKPQAAEKVELSRVVLRVNHRVFANFAQLDTVVLDQEFPVGDSDMSARIVRFVPDFAIDSDRSIVSRSPQPNNPAVQVVVMEGGAPYDTSWAFLNFPPHFSAKSVLAFQILRLDFKNREPLLSKTLLEREAAGGKKP